MLFGKHPKRTSVVRIDGTAVWHVIHDRADDMWYGVCDALNLNAIGETYVELQECVAEAMHLLFVDLYRDGELDAFLRRNGWTASDDVTPGDAPDFMIPIKMEERQGLMA